MVILVDLLVVILLAVIAAGIVTAIGPNRVARWLRLPPGDYS